MVRASLKPCQVTLYLPSEVDVSRWKSLSKAKGCSLSKFVYEMTERSLEEKRVIPKARPTASEEMVALRGEVSELRREVDQLKRQNIALKETHVVPEDAAAQYRKWIMAIFSMKPDLKNDEVKERLGSYAEQWSSRIISKVLRDWIDDGTIKESERGLKWVRK